MSKPTWKNLYGLPIYDHPETPRHMLTSIEILHREAEGTTIRDVVFHMTRGDGSKFAIHDPAYLTETGGE